MHFFVVNVVIVINLLFYKQNILNTIGHNFRGDNTTQEISDFGWNTLRFYSVTHLIFEVYPYVHQHTHRNFSSEHIIAERLQHQL